MDAKMEKKMLEAAVKEVTAMLKQHFEDQDNGIVSEKAVFRFPIGLGVEIQPEAGDMRVSAKIRWGIIRKDETAGVVCSNQPQLDLK